MEINDSLSNQVNPLASNESLCESVHCPSENFTSVSSFWKDDAMTLTDSQTYPASPATRELTLLLQLTYELEVQQFNKKRSDAEAQLATARQEVFFSFHCIITKLPPSIIPANPCCKHLCIWFCIQQLNSSMSIVSYSRTLVECWGCLFCFHIDMHTPQKEANKRQACHSTKQISLQKALLLNPRSCLSTVLIDPMACVR